jgi:hypothetical protein
LLDVVLAAGDAVTLLHHLPDHTFSVATLSASVFGASSVYWMDVVCMLRL